MVKIIRSLREMDIAEMATVYGLDEQENYAEFQDVFDYLREDFFTVGGAFYAVLSDERGYASVLRAEPYCDGYLIEALQTRPDARNKGFAKELLRSVISGTLIPETLPIYSHIRKDNKASLAVHRFCGFTQHLDYAKYIDGSVYTHSCTMIYKK